jgi:hypothetical protein
LFCLSRTCDPRTNMLFKNSPEAVYSVRSRGVLRPSYTIAGDGSASSLPITLGAFHRLQANISSFPHLSSHTIVDIPETAGPSSMKTGEEKRV